MKITRILVGIFIVVIIATGLWWYFAKDSKISDINSVTTATNTTASATKHFTVNGNDETADLLSITIPKGTSTSITFGADAGSTYHQGLDFRSSVVSTGTIEPGSTKTVSFTADHSFIFTPYWPSTNITDPYTIKVLVD